MNALVKFMKDEKGPTLLEYVALGVLLILVIWGAVQLVSGAAGNALTDIANRFGTR